MGALDRIIRAIIAIIFAVLYFTETITGTWGIVLLIVGAIFLITSVFGYCPIYSLLGLNTCPKK